MIALFRRSNPFNILLLFVYTVGLHTYLYLKPFDPTYIHIASPLGYFLFEWLYNLPTDIHRLFTILTIVMSIANGMMLNYTLNYYKLISQFNLLPAFIFITISSVLPGLDLFSPEILTCFFFMVAIHCLLALYKGSHNSNAFFDIGLMLGIAILLVPAYWTMGLFFFASFLILRPFAILEWATAFLGILIPILLCGTIFFILDKLPLFLNLIEPEFQQWDHYNFIKNIPIKEYVPLGFIVISGLIAGISFQRFLPKMVVQLRTYYNIYFRLLGFAFLMNILHKANGLQHYMLLVVPFSLPLCFVFGRAKRLLWLDAWWLFIVALIVIMPYIR